MVEKRCSHIKLSDVPPNAERCVSMVEFKGKMYLATEYHIYRVDEKGEIFQKLQFEETIEEKNGK